jgi:hypothetical protein
LKAWAYVVSAGKFRESGHFFSALQRAKSLQNKKLLRRSVAFDVAFRESLDQGSQRAVLRAEPGEAAMTAIRRFPSSSFGAKLGLLNGVALRQ